MPEFGAHANHAGLFGWGIAVSPLWPRQAAARGPVEEDQDGFLQILSGHAMLGRSIDGRMTGPCAEEIPRQADDLLT